MLNISKAEITCENLLFSNVDGRTDRHDKTNTFLHFALWKHESPFLCIGRYSIF